MASVELEGHAQRERAAKAERDLLELQERAKPRTIAPDARTAILAALAAKVPDGPIRVIYIGGSVNEPDPLAYSIAELLKEARWTVSSTSGGPYTGTPPTGILVRVSAADNPPPERASVLEQALAAGGLNPRLVRVTSGVVEDGEVELLVGLKP